MRLKGGDPFVFGRGGEEAQALHAAGIAFEIVPGISSAIAAPAYAGIPVTHREINPVLTIATGHEDPTKAAIDDRLGQARRSASHARAADGNGQSRRRSATRLIAHGLVREHAGCRYRKMGRARRSAP